MSGLSVHEQHIHDYNCNFIVLLTAKLKTFCLFEIEDFENASLAKKKVSTQGWTFNHIYDQNPTITKETISMTTEHLHPLMKSTQWGWKLQKPLWLRPCGETFLAFLCFFLLENIKQKMILGSDFIQSEPMKRVEGENWAAVAPSGGQQGEQPETMTSHFSCHLN